MTRQDETAQPVFNITQKRTRLNVKKTRPIQTVQWIHPIGVERQYNRILQVYLKQIEKLTDEIVIPHLPSLVDEADNELMRNQDSFGESTDRLMNNLRLGIAGLAFNPEPVAVFVGDQTNTFNEMQWQKVLKNTVGVPLFQSQPWLTPLMGSFVAENVVLINSLPANYVVQVEGIIQRGLKDGARHKTIAKDIENQFGVTQRRAKLIARDQVSKLNGQLTKQKQEGIGITKYIWRTAQDERVRPTHRANNEKSFDWNNPPPTGHPGSGVQCRCSSIGDFTDIIADLEQGAQI